MILPSAREVHAELACTECNKRRECVDGRTSNAAHMEIIVAGQWCASAVLVILGKQHQFFGLLGLLRLFAAGLS